MKLLFDQNLSFKLCSRLASLFPGSDQALERPGRISKDSFFKTYPAIRVLAFPGIRGS